MRKNKILMVIEDSSHTTFVWAKTNGRIRPLATKKPVTK
jgi:hypothetical protein